MVKISREHVVTNGRAAFYACVWDDLRNAAMDCGWALGLHGSLKSDMDIMAMPWVEDAKPAEEMIKALADCFTGNIFAERQMPPYTDKPHGRIVYTISIWSDFYLDISIMPSITKIKNESNYKCIDCEWEGDIKECDFDYDHDEFKRIDLKYPICPKCSGGVEPW